MIVSNHQEFMKDLMWKSEQKKDLQPVNGLLKGNIPDDLIEVNENGFRFLVDIKEWTQNRFLS